VFVGRPERGDTLRQGFVAIDGRRAQLGLKAHDAETDHSDAYSVSLPTFIPGELIRKSRLGTPSGLTW